MDIRAVAEKLLGEMYAENQRMELRAEGVKLLYERLVAEQQAEQSGATSGEAPGGTEQPAS